MNEYKKQIEEIAKELCPHYDNGNCYYEVTEVCECCFGCEFCWAVSQVLNAGYRKISENEVVLTEKEYERYERIEKIIKLAKREKANGYEVKNGKLYYFTNMLEGFEHEFKDLQEICDAANHYNEEFFGLQQRLDFWKYKAETTAKETAEKFAARVKMAFYYEFDELIPSIMADKIDEICNEITEGKV